MGIRTFFLAAALAASTLVAPVAPAEARAGGAPCVFHRYEVTSVRPVRAREVIGRGALVERLKGAEVRVRAERGLTAEWLRAEVGRHLRAMERTSMADCALDVDGVRIGVESTGAGFSIRILTDDVGQAREIVRRAEMLAD